MRPAILALALLCAASAWAADSDPSELTLRTERCIVFKNGTCLVIKRGSAVSDAQGRIRCRQVPEEATLGTVWATSNEGRLLSLAAEVRSHPSTSATMADCRNYAALLKANAGREVAVTLQDRSTLSGSIVRVLTDGLLILRTAGYDATVPVDEIRYLHIRDMALSYPIAAPLQQVNELTLRFADAQRRHEVRLAYLRTGLRWIPSYRIDLAADDAPVKRADIRLQAEIINELEDLAGVPVDLVVGAPHFRYQGSRSPLALQAVVSRTLSEADPHGWGQQNNNAFRNTLVTQINSRTDEQANTPPEIVNQPVELPGELTAVGTKDLFIYRVPALDLTKGGRAIVPLLNTQATYRDLYTWQVRSRHDADHATPDADTPLQLATNEIWHQIVLDNATSMPWTSGPALFQRGEQVLAQELLTYTPAGTAVRVPLMVAVNLRGNADTRETGRTFNALSIRKHSYTRIDQEGRLSLSNHTQQAVEVEIVWELGGEIDRSTDQASAVTRGFDAADWNGDTSLAAVNKHSQVRWRSALAPGATFTPSIAYHYLLRH